MAKKRITLKEFGNNMTKQLVKISPEAQFADEIMRERVENLTKEIIFCESEKELFLDKIKEKIKLHLYETDISNILAREDIYLDYMMARGYHRKCVDAKTQLDALEKYLYP